MAIWEAAKAIGTQAASNAKNIGTDALNSVTGNVDTALLVIHDYRELAKEKGIDVMSQSPKTAAMGQKMFQMYRTVDELERSRATSAALSGSPVQSYSQSTDRIMKVRFNPSQLTLNASALPKSAADAGTKAGRTQSVEDAKLNLTVSLYFDDMNVMDSFMWDKAAAERLIANGLLTAVNPSRLLDGKKTYSVQAEVEALISALRNPFTRSISFCWNDFTFTGQLNTVQSRYTMFSTSGRPVRAQVLLRILHDSGRFLNDWYENFEKAFSGASSDLVNAGQTVGNLLNLNF